MFAGSDPSLVLVLMALQTTASFPADTVPPDRYDLIIARIGELSRATSTPRQTVESLIEAGNLRSELVCYEAERNRLNPVIRNREIVEANYRSSFFAGDALQSAQRFGSHTRDLQTCLSERHIQTVEIVDVDVSDASQVTVEGRIRNVTPLPRNVTLSAENARRKADGEVYRYSIVRGAIGWRVRQAYRYDQYAEGGMRASYEPNDPFQVAYWYTSAD